MGADGKRGKKGSLVWWWIPVNTALKRQDRCMYKANLVNTESSRPACTVQKDCLKKRKEQAIKGTLAFNPCTGGFLNLKSAWSTEQAPGQPVLHNYIERACFNTHRERIWEYNISLSFLLSPRNYDRVLTSTRIIKFLYIIGISTYSAHILHIFSTTKTGWAP